MSKLVMWDPEREAAIVARIIAMAEEEGRRRFAALAERYGLPLGEYEGRPCALVADVARVFGVTDRAVQKALVGVLQRFPDASVRCNPAEVRGTNFKFVPNVTVIIAIFWRGFLALSRSGRGPAHDEIQDFLTAAEGQGRTTAAAATVAAEQYEQALAERNAALATLGQVRGELGEVRDEQRALRRLIEERLPRPEPSSLPAGKPRLPPPTTLSQRERDALLRRDGQLKRRSRGLFLVAEGREQLDLLNDRPPKTGAPEPAKPGVVDVAGVRCIGPLSPERAREMREARQKHTAPKLLLPALARLLGVPRGRLGRYERGVEVPPRDVQRRWLAVLQSYPDADAYLRRKGQTAAAKAAAVV